MRKKCNKPPPWIREFFIFKGGGFIKQQKEDNGVLGAPIGCIDPQYWFGGRTSSAKKIDFEKIFIMILGVKKSIFFWLFKKWRHIAWDGQYRVSECFPGPKRLISGQISYFRPLYKKLWIFEKSDFSWFFAIFSILADLISGRDRPEMAGSTQNVQKCVLETL